MLRGIAFAVMLMLVAGCVEIREPQPDPNRYELPQQEFFDARITFYQNDVVAGVLEAGRIRKFERQSMVLLDSGVVMDFFNAEGRHTSKLWADSARTDEARKSMVAMGNVIAKSDSGDMLETEELRWDNQTRQIRSDMRVKLSTPTDTVWGIGFVSDENMKNWRIDQPTGRTFRNLERRTPRDSSQVPPQAVATADSL